MVQIFHTVLIESADLEDPDELVEALAVRGLAAHRLEDGDVEIGVAGDHAWNLEVISALEGWLEETGRAEVEATVGGATYTVRSPAALPVGALQETAELPAPTRRGGLLDPVAILAALGGLLLLAAGVWLLLVAF